MENEDAALLMVGVSFVHQAAARQGMGCRCTLAAGSM
jgi:hypothetical protein